MKNLNKIKVILWDFDGVIINSNAIRDKGFEIVLKEFPDDQVSKLLTFHKKNGGLSRYVKFRYFFEEIRGEKISDDEINNWAAKFSRIMLNKLKDNSLLISETINFIEKNCNNFQMHIVSGSDEIELKELCRSLKIEQFFSSIKGSPTPKKDLVHNILSTQDYDPHSVVLIGDSINDYEAAKYNNIFFMGYNNSFLEKKSDVKLY